MTTTTGKLTQHNKRTFSFTNSTFLWNLVFVLTMLVYAVGLFIDIMEPDAAVYAQIAMEMHDRNDLLSIYHKGQDWLDKPHFPFWMSAFSYEIFGVNTVAYKLPAILFILIGAVYTFLFARKFYSSLHGWLAVLILITAEHIIISNQDVRAEPFMTGLVIMGLYHLVMLLAFRRFHWGHAAAGSFALACLMMTKGLFTIIPVAAGIGLTLLYQRRWKDILHYRWLLVILLTLVFLTPSLYGYYRQFDMHPEKTVFGEQGVSGVEFFLWTSQWGRFTNTGPIKGKGDLSFFVHTMLWAFLPWAFAGFFALYHKTKQLIKGPKPVAGSINSRGTATRNSVTTGRISQLTTSAHPAIRGEHFTYFGFITLFLIFSFSSFQLSFYLNPLFPLLAILTTAMVLDAKIKTLRVFSIIHFVVCILLLIGLFLLHAFFGSTGPHVDSLIIVSAGLITGYYLFTRRGILLKKIFFATALVVLSVNYYVNRDFYPALLTYQAESQVAHYMHAEGIPAKELVIVGDVQSVADVILQHTTPIVPLDSLTPAAITGAYVFTSPEGREKMDSLAINYEVLKTFEDFHVTRLTGQFINEATRKDQVQLKYLLRVEGRDGN